MCVIMPIDARYGQLEKGFFSLSLMQDDMISAFESLTKYLQR